MLASTGCATLRATFGGYATGPNGISRPQQQLREAMEASDFTAALGWREDDVLLRALNVGIASYYAEQYARSGAVLDSAALLADDRITASLSRNALSMLTNDMARPYQLRRTERLFIPYYGMLAYARLGAWEDAAVEARRISGLLAQYAADRDHSERALHASLHHLAGAVFERAGNRGEAEVAYRLASELYSALPETLALRDTSQHGELLVVVERGFVAHRTTETIDIVLGDEDRDSLRHSGESRGRAVTRIAERAAILRRSEERGTSSLLAHWGQPSYRGHRSHDDDDEYHLTIAFPSLRRSRHSWRGAPRVAVDDQQLPGVEMTSVLDDASSVDERRERVAVATRALARAAAKYAITKAIKEKKGEVAGTLANIGASMMERADVRSWHLLPQEISLLRVRLPAGARHLRLQVGAGSSARAVDLGTVVILAGTVTIAPVRLWPRQPWTFVKPTEPLLAEADSSCSTSLCP
jgi:hypothetical protein